MSKPAKLPMNGVTVREILKTMFPPVKQPPLTAQERRVMARALEIASVRSCPESDRFQAMPSKERDKLIDSVIRRSRRTREAQR